MAQGLDLKTWNGNKSPSMDSKSAENVKKTRGIGSRRIFPPQFKLQVLDSYRNDVDCRGNQRATARKYNIHRRQIQKWLQCEQNLRTTVEETTKSELLDSKSPKIVEDKTDLTLNQSATAFARLGDAGRPKENKPIEESKLEAQNLKRVAQKLYPSLQSIPCVQGEKVTRPSDGQKFYGGDVGCAFRLPPADTRDDNFNKVIRTDDGPLDLKSKVRSEVLPEFLASNASGPSPDHDSAKLSVSPPSEESSSPSDHIGGQKLSVSDAVLKCRVQKYADDVGGLKFYSSDAEKKKESLRSSSAEHAEPSRLSDVRVPINSVPYVAASPANRALGDVASDVNLSVCSPDTRHKKPTTDASDRKSFNPKRKWMKESMQEMEDAAEHSQDTSSLPIKQRVKMNLRSLPEGSYGSDDCDAKTPAISSSFTIERLCSVTTKENEPSYGNHSHRRHSENDRFTLPIDVSFIPLKEERVSDAEDADVDVTSTTPVEKKSFDFSAYNFGKRRSFSVQFKLTVLDAFYNDKDCNKNQRATARKFNINRRQVQKWLSQESDLRSEGSVKNGKYLHRQRLGGESREGGDACTGCPRHCLRRKEVEEYDKTIQVNVKHCSDDCLSRRHQDHSKTDFCSKNFFQSDLKSNFYSNYLFPENNNLLYHESILGWPSLNTSALSVPNLQYLSTWHQSFDFCPENQQIC